MARNPRGCASLFLWLVLSLHILYFTTAVDAKSGHRITDAEIRMKKDECYADIESGLWGLNCKTSIIAKENCALRCLSPRCYELVYESDPLEEGEKDLIRSQEYKYCMYRALHIYLLFQTLNKYKVVKPNTGYICFLNPTDHEDINWRKH